MRSAHALVTLDCRRKRLRNGIRNRIECRSCDGSVSSFGLCANSMAIFVYLKQVANELSLFDSTFIGITNNGSFGQVQLERMVPEEEMESRGREFTSKQKRNVFPCVSEENIMRVTLREMSKQREEQLRSATSNTFVGVDAKVSCSSCKNAVDISNE